MPSEKILVVGDFIQDFYRICVATHMCPEAPIPILVKIKSTESQPRAEYTTDGGAALVAAQLRELIGHGNVIVAYGSSSVKERIFADGRLMCRVDNDGCFIAPRQPFYFKIRQEMHDADAVIVSDYGKGGMDAEAAKIVMETAKTMHIPVFVDAKHNWEWYPDAFALFPNQREIKSLNGSCLHLIQKLGEHGCSVDGDMVEPITHHAVKDVTGAGDIFLAAFVAHYVYNRMFDGNQHTKLLDAAHFANHIAGLSVEHVGTYVVKEPSFFS